MFPKFRAYHKKFNIIRWVYRLHWAAPNRLHHVLVDLNEGDKHTLGVPEQWYAYPERNEIDLIRWTGLTDKKGNELYEHDIIFFEAEDPDSDIGCTWIYGLVYWDEYNSQWQIKNHGWEYDMPELRELDFTIQGNIFHNAELLNETA